MAKAKKEELEPIVWEPKRVKLEELRENLSNPKIINEQGLKRLHKSIDKFGPAGTFIVNADLTIIDGHSRKADLLERGVEEVWVSMPSRQLTEEEYKEMNAIYDAARASDIDMFMVGNMFSDIFMEDWDLIGEEPGKKKKAEKEKDDRLQGEPKYPIIPRYDEKYKAIIIVSSNEIDLAYIKNKLGIDDMMSYKNKTVKETSVITSDQFIKQWKANHGG